MLCDSRAVCLQHNKPFEPFHTLEEQSLPSSVTLGSVASRREVVVTDEPTWDIQVEPARGSCGEPHLSLRVTGQCICLKYGTRLRTQRPNPMAVQMVWEKFGMAGVDLFASEASTHYLQWFLLVEPISPLGQNVLVHPWPDRIF